MFASAYFVLTFLLLKTAFVQAVLDESEYSEELKKLAETLHESCAAVTGIDDALINKVKNGEFPDDPTLKKYIKCALISSTVMDENGELNHELIVHLLPKKYTREVMKALDICAPKVKVVSTLEDKGLTLVKCVLSESPDIFPFF